MKEWSDLMNYTALIVAAGSGSRMGLGYNKLLYPLSEQQTVIEKTASIFIRDQRCKQIIIVTSEADTEQMKQLFQGSDITFVLGGKTRQESVYNGLQQVKEAVVLIHDGARPWLSLSCIDDLLACLKKHRACLLCVPVKDTIKRVQNGVISQTYPRAELMQAQTPQAFHLNVIKAAYEKAMLQNIGATDDAQIVELFTEVKVHVVEGSYENRKITTKEDLY